MGESLITISIVGLLAGFIFSMPIAGPISILVTSNALKGRVLYCYLVAIGASFADMVYVFLAVFGITKLYSWMEPGIPYILMAGSLLIFFMGYKIFRSKIDLEHVPELHPKTGKPIPEWKGGLYTGFMINFLNPTLIIGWLTTSILVITFISSLGFDTGGLDKMIDQNVKTLNIKDSVTIRNTTVPSYLRPDTLKIFKNHPEEEPATRPGWFPWMISLCYAVALALGSILWFMTLAVTLARFRKQINLKILKGMVKGLGIVLCLFGLYFAGLAIKMLL